MNTVIETTSAKLTQKTLTAICSHFGHELEKDFKTGLYYIGKDHQGHTAKEIIDFIKLVYGNITVSYGYNMYNQPVQVQL